MGMLKASVAMGTMCSHQDGHHESFTLGESSFSALALSSAENALQQLACKRDQETVEYGDESQTSAGGEGAAQADHGGPLAVAALALGDSIDLLAPPTPNGTQHNMRAREEEEPSAVAAHGSGAGDKEEGDAALSRDVYVLGEEDHGQGRSAEAKAQDEMEVDVAGPEAANGAEDQGGSAPALAGGSSTMAGIDEPRNEGKAEAADATLPPDAEAASQKQDDAETQTDDDEAVECKSVDEGNISDEGQQLAGASTSSAEAETGAASAMSTSGTGEAEPQKIDSSSRAAGSFMEAAEDDQDASQFTQPGESQFQHATGNLELNPKNQSGLNRDSSEEGEAEGEWTRSEEDLQPSIKRLLAIERRKVEVMEEKFATMAEENQKLVGLKDQLQRLRQDNDEAEQEVVQMTVSRAYLSTFISTLRKKHRLSFNSAHHVVCDLARS